MATLEDDARRKLITNERAKLVATYLNGVAVGVFVIGGVAPIVSFVFASDASRPRLAVVVLVMVICQAASAGLHLVAQRPLGRVRP